MGAAVALGHARQIFVDRFEQRLERVLRVQLLGFEGLAAVVWHLLVSHPALKRRATRWESVK